MVGRVDCWLLVCYADLLSSYDAQYCRISSMCVWHMCDGFSVVFWGSLLFWFVGVILQMTLTVPSVVLFMCIMLLFSYCSVGSEVYCFDLLSTNYDASDLHLAHKIEG